MEVTITLIPNKKSLVINYGVETIITLIFRKESGCLEALKYLVNLLGSVGSKKKFLTPEVLGMFFKNNELYFLKSLEVKGRGLKGHRKYPLKYQHWSGVGIELYFYNSRAQRVFFEELCGGITVAEKRLGLHWDYVVRVLLSGKFVHGAVGVKFTKLSKILTYRNVSS